MEVFSQGIINSGESIVNNPMEPTFIPNWNRIINAIPDIGSRLSDAASADNNF